MSATSVVRRIHLIRHGETNWNREKRAQGQQESVLSSEGIKQAQTLKSRLQTLNISAVYCSSSIRTRQTADILFGEHSLPVIYCDHLREIHMGPWEGRLYSELRDSYPEQFHAFWHQPENFLLAGAETYADVQLRAVRRLDAILKESNAADLAIVSHGVLIKTILCDAEQRPLTRLWEAPAMHNCAHSVVDIHADGSRRISLYADQAYN